MAQTDLPGTRLTRRYLIGSLHQRNHSRLRPHETMEHHRFCDKCPRNYPKDEGEPKDGSSTVIHEASELSGQTTEASGVDY